MPFICLAGKNEENANILMYIYNITYSLCISTCMYIFALYVHMRLMLLALKSCFVYAYTYVYTYIYICTYKHTYANMNNRNNRTVRLTKKVSHIWRGKPIFKGHTHTHKYTYYELQYPQIRFLSRLLHAYSVLTFFLQDVPKYSGIPQLALTIF